MTNLPPPHDPTAEASLVSAILLGHVEPSTVADHCKPTDCYLPATRAVFAAALAVEAAGGKVDSTSIATRLRQSNELEAIGGVPALASLTYDAPSIAEPMAYAVTIAQLAQRRRVIDWAHSVAATSATDTGDHKGWLAELESGFSVATHVGDSVVEFSECCPVLDEIQADVMAKADGTFQVSAVFGIPDLDRAIGGGTATGDLCIIAARTGVGKSALACQVANGTSGIGRGVAFFSLEMSKKQVVARIATLTVPKIPIDGIAPRFKVGSDTFRNIASAKAALQNRGIYVCDIPTLNPSRIRSLARKAFAKCEARGIERGCIIIDYLQLMKADQREKEKHIELSEICKALKRLAKELGVTVFLLSQINRDTESRSNKSNRPRLSDLKGSGAIEEDADAVFFPFRPGMYDETRKGEAIQLDADIEIAKMRNGACAIIPCEWDGPRNEFRGKASQFEKELDDLFDLDNG